MATFLTSSLKKFCASTLLLALFSLVILPTPFLSAHAALDIDNLAASQLLEGLMHAQPHLKNLPPKRAHLIVADAVAELQTPLARVLDVVGGNAVLEKAFFALLGQLTTLPASTTRAKLGDHYRQAYDAFTDELRLVVLDPTKQESILNDVADMSVYFEMLAISRAEHMLKSKSIFTWRNAGIATIIVVVFTALVLMIKKARANAREAEAARLAKVEAARLAEAVEKRMKAESGSSSFAGKLTKKNRVALAQKIAATASRRQELQSKWREMVTAVLEKSSAAATPSVLPVGSSTAAVGGASHPGNDAAMAAMAAQAAAAATLRAPYPVSPPRPGSNTRGAVAVAMATLVSPSTHITNAKAHLLAARTAAAEPLCRVDETRTNIENGEFHLIVDRDQWDAALAALPECIKNDPGNLETAQLLLLCKPLSSADVNTGFIRRHDKYTTTTERRAVFSASFSDRDTPIRLADKLRARFFGHQGNGARKYNLERQKVVNQLRRVLSANNIKDLRAQNDTLSDLLQPEN